MALTKSSTVEADFVSLSGGGASITSTAYDLSGNYRTVARIQLQTTSTGPPVPAQVQVQISESSSTGWMVFETAYGSTAVSSCSNYAIMLPDPTKRARFVYGSNTCCDVLCRIVLDQITSL